MTALHTGTARNLRDPRTALSRRGHLGKRT